MILNNISLVFNYSFVYHWHGLLNKSPHFILDSAAATQEDTAVTGQVSGSCSRERGGGVDVGLDSHFVPGAPARGIGAHVWLWPWQHQVAHTFGVDQGMLIPECNICLPCLQSLLLSCVTSFYFTWGHPCFFKGLVLRNIRLIVTHDMQLSSSFSYMTGFWKLLIFKAYNLFCPYFYPPQVMKPYFKVMV